MLAILEFSAGKQGALRVGCDGAWNRYLASVMRGPQLDYLAALMFDSEFDE